MTQPKRQQAAQRSFAPPTPAAGLVFAMTRRRSPNPDRSGTADWDRNRPRQDSPNHTSGSPPRVPNRPGRRSSGAAVAAPPTRGHPPPTTRTHPPPAQSPDAAAVASPTWVQPVRVQPVQSQPVRVEPVRVQPPQAHSPDAATATMVQRAGEAAQRLVARQSPAAGQWIGVRPRH